MRNKHKAKRLRSLVNVLRQEVQDLENYVAKSKLIKQDQSYNCGKIAGMIRCIDELEIIIGYYKERENKLQV